MTTSAAPRVGHPDDAARVAALHMSELPHGFLVALGERFLVRLYRRVARYEGSFLLVTGDGDHIDGFIAVAEGTGGLYREFLLKDGLVAGLLALPAVVRAPRRTWETFRYGTGADEAADLPEAEILSVAVAPSARGRGLGRTLVSAAVQELASRGIGSVQVVTAVDNEPGLRMYEAAGFTRRATTQVHEGVDQAVLVWG